MRPLYWPTKCEPLDGKPTGCAPRDFQGTQRRSRGMKIQRRDNLSETYHGPAPSRRLQCSVELYSRGGSYASFVIPTTATLEVSGDFVSLLLSRGGSFHSIHSYPHHGSWNRAEDVSFQQLWLCLLKARICQHTDTVASPPALSSAKQ